METFCSCPKQNQLQGYSHASFEAELMETLIFLKLTFPPALMFFSHASFEAELMETRGRQI